MLRIATQTPLTTGREAGQSSFEFLAAATSFRAKLLGAIPTFNPLFSRRQSLNLKFELVANEWIILRDSEPVANLRMVHIWGAKNEIINTWVFPFRPSETPVFAAELIGVGGSIKVAFIDIQTPAMNQQSAEEVAALTGPVSERFNALPCDEEAPDWAVADSQGKFTYARNVGCDQLGQVEDCYLAYLDTYLDAYMKCNTVQSRNIATGDTRAQDVLHIYQCHHMEHSPGKKFLSVLFGAQWTEAFMKNFLFTLPRG